MRDTYFFRSKDLGHLARCYKHAESGCDNHWLYRGRRVTCNMYQSMELTNDRRFSAWPVRWKRPTGA
jgi:hypothetical protein